MNAPWYNNHEHFEDENLVICQAFRRCNHTYCVHRKPHHPTTNIRGDECIKEILCGQIGEDRKCVPYKEMKI